MSQPNTRPKCAVCGGSNFIAEAGFFFCSECNTQSQDIREEVYDDYFGNQKVTTRVLQKKTQSNTGGQEEKLTSWEVLNYVLKGITEEIIELGAKPSLKIVVLQLWASYLQKLEVAFTSTQIERKPKLGYVFKHSDAAIIYGLTEKELRRKSWRTRSKGSSGASSTSDKSDSDVNNSASSISQSRRSILRKLTIRKKALASAEYSQQSQDTARSLSQSQTLELLDSNSETEGTPKRLKVTKYTRLLLNSSGTSSTEDESRSLQRSLFKREVSSLRNVTMAKLVAIVNVALAINKEDILLSDFLRWVEEGHISLRTASKFLPTHLKINTQVQRMLEVHTLSYGKCQQLMTALCHELDIINLPHPDVLRLTDRYCLELQLPDGISGMAKKLLRLSLNNEAAKVKIHESLYPEVQVMAAIIIVMKLLFSFDGCSEYRLSYAAAEINKASHSNGEPLELFVLSEWMQFVECRKAVVASCHLPTRVTVYGQTIPRDTRLFLQHYSQVAADIRPWEANKRYTLDKQWVEAMTRCLKNLVTPEPEPVNEVRLPASLTPLHSSIQHLLTRHPERVTTVRHILELDHTQHSLVHVIQQDRCAAIGLANDLNIIQQPGASAIFKVENISQSSKDSLIIPRSGINKFNVRVNVVKKIKRAKVTNASQTIDKKRLSFVKEIISDDSDEEENYAENVVQEPESQNVELGCFSSHIDLYKPCSQYWFCHTKLGKNDMTFDEFELFSKKMLPSSFLWLLKECSRLIQNPPKNLYANIISLEDRYKHILNEAQFLKRNHKRKRS